MAFENLGKALTLVRRQSGMSQVELADCSGIGRSQISRYESGREKMKLDTLEKILAALELAPEDFFRFVGSLDPATEVRRRRGAVRIDERLLDDTFRRLHAALDELRKVVGRAIDPAVRFAMLIEEAAGVATTATDAGAGHRPRDASREKLQSNSGAGIADPLADRPG
jgi:transcriptional regulator with XRE-family HTH domain